MNAKSKAPCMLLICIMLALLLSVSAFAADSYPLDLDDCYASSDQAGQNRITSAAAGTTVYIHPTGTSYSDPSGGLFVTKGVTTKGDRPGPFYFTMPAFSVYVGSQQVFTTVPVTGFMRPMNGNTAISKDDLSVPKNAPFKIDHLDWFDASDPDTPIAAGGFSFEGGRSYFARIYLKSTNSRYYFSFSSYRDGYSINNNGIRIASAVYPNNGNTLIALITEPMTALYKVSFSGENVFGSIDNFADPGQDYTAYIKPSPGFTLSAGDFKVGHPGSTRPISPHFITYDPDTGTLTVAKSQITKDLVINAYPKAVDPKSAFVSRMYVLCLGREPGSQDMSGCLWQLNNGTSGAEFAYHFLFSDEFKAKNYCDYHYIEALYMSFTGRVPGSAEINYWTYRLQQGDARETVFNEFIRSAEFGSLCSQYGLTVGSPVSFSGKGTKPGGRCSVSGCRNQDGIVSFATRLYSVSLNRSCSADEANAWAYYLIHGDHTAKSASRFFFTCDEIKGQNLSNGEYVSRLYRAMLGREPDQGGLEYWVWLLESSSSREAVFEQFAASAEFAAICQGYGLICE